MKKDLLTNQSKIDLYQSLFRGREDIFAVRWQSADGKKRGYSPVCLNEWIYGLCLKTNRGHCRECSHKSYAVWNDHFLARHLSGQKAYGFYPLLPDGTSYFLAVDFDGENWQKDVVKFIKSCRKYNLEPHIEKSNSGDGCHTWFFFEEKYPAEKSRLIFQTILEKDNLIDKFNKDASFDRIFPCQDSVDAEGIGNLIMLPLHGAAKILGNTIFLNPDDLKPVSDQWQYLQRIRKIEAKFLDHLYGELFGVKFKSSSGKKSKLNIEISNEIILHGKNLPYPLTMFLKENLNFVNPEYLIKKRMGIGTYNLEKYFNLIESKPNKVALPRGFSKELIRFLDEQNISYEINDNRTKLKQVKFDSSLNLYDNQKLAVVDLLQSEQGILVAPPGSGKTIIGLELISKLGQPALIVVHKRQIYNQWLERIESLLNIPKKEIGQICSTKKKVGSKITVAMIQTLHRMDSKELHDKFGVIFVDECHHLPAKMFRQVITKFNPFYLYGLTATPERKYKDERLIFIYLGEILHQINNNSRADNLLKLEDSHQPGLKIVIKETNFDLPFKVTMNNSQLMQKALIFDTGRNSQITADIFSEAKTGSKCLVLTERREHAEVLAAYLNKELETVTLTGELTEKKKKEKLKQIETGDFQVIVATGQLLGEGTDIGGLDCLFLVYPFSFHGKLTQYIGRITRNFNDGAKGKIYDYRDSKIGYLDRIFKRRKSYYDKNGLTD